MVHRDVLCNVLRGVSVVCSVVFYGVLGRLRLSPTLAGVGVGEPGFSAAVPSGASHQTAATGIHHPHPALDVRAELQGKVAETARFAHGIHDSFHTPDYNSWGGKGHIHTRSRDRTG